MGWADAQRASVDYSRTTQTVPAPGKHGGEQESTCCSGQANGDPELNAALVGRTYVHFAKKVLKA